MREYKFRAWDKKENKYIDIIGFYFFDKHITLWYLDSEAIPDFKKVHIDKIIIEQYTRLKDKNGKDIYEGDIVNIGEPGYTEPCEVVFNEGCFCIKAKWTEALIELNNYCNNVFEQCVEIIGNIHDS